MSAETGRRAVFSIGSNLGDRLGYLQRAVNELRSLPLTDVAISSVYDTEPMDFTDQPDFLNAIVIGSVALPAAELLRQTARFETAIGRVRVSAADPPNSVKGPRVIDIDLIAVWGEQIDSAELTLPHPRAHQRGFVLVPWLEVDATAWLPGRGSAADLLAALPPQRVRRRTDLELA
ncbi:MAG: 2-amino-4-hydroxy-6-hydroxymethyldihydropteridine diphosphokinase [Propionibacteriaceae bacterium]|nr:2-amino-4-hydroxy-6-hydroxymethyldihydropteridine diphosphokinase [Propionibacteriaceae bacterium]